LRFFGEHHPKASACDVLRKNALENQQLVSALGSALLGEKHLSHPTDPQPPYDLELSQLLWCDNARTGFSRFVVAVG
jgi:hypothetical protein